VYAIVMFLLTTHPQGSYEVYAVKPPSDEPVRTLETALLRSWDAYPSVKSGPPPLTAEEVAELIRNPEKGGDKIAIIDVRRNDHDVSATWISFVFCFKSNTCSLCIPWVNFN
jgi:hypothetical protein